MNQEAIIIDIKQSNDIKEINMLMSREGAPQTSLRSLVINR